MRSDEELREITVGEVRRIDGPIPLADYDPTWVEQFDDEARRVREALGDLVVSLEHVGSTAVPGLAAKPVIDMVLVVADSSDEAAWLPPLEAVGYAVRIREPEWWEHRLLSSPDRDVNLHVFSAGCPEVERMVRFRDHLRNHHEDRELYGATKKRLASLTWRYVQDYADAKSEVVEAILTRADVPDQG